MLWGTLCFFDPLGLPTVVASALAPLSEMHHAQNA
jgi:hypothetical protein